MVIHRDQCRADARDVLDEFEAWLLRERSTQEGTAAAYTARVAGFVEWRNDQILWMVPGGWGARDAPSRG